MEKAYDAETVKSYLGLSKNLSKGPHYFYSTAGSTYSAIHDLWQFPQTETLFFGS